MLAHLLRVNKWQPNYAKNAAVKYAALDPYQLSDMPELLEKALLQQDGTSP